MDKNTVIAIVLSFLVLSVSFVIQDRFILPRQQAAAAREQEAAQEAEQERAAAQQEAADRLLSGSASDAPSVPESEYVITTDKVQVTFTNRGGDIISYKLLEHEDTTTGSPVEMVNNVTDTNRAFAVSLEGADAPIINDVFNVSRPDDRTIIFTRTYGAFTIGKRYTFKDGEYVFRLDISTVSEEDAPLAGDVAYTLRTSPQVGPVYDRNNRYEVRQALALNNGRRVRRNISNRTYDLNSLDWAGVASKYFAMLIKPDDPAVMQNSMRVSGGAGDAPDAQVILSRRGIPASSAGGGGASSDTFYVYTGPRQESELIKYNNQDRNAWGISNARFNEALQTNGFLSWLEVALRWALETINRLVRNWGVSIIILTIILKLILFPLNSRSAAGALKMQRIQPRMQELQQRYANDQQKLSAELQKLYKEAGYNPMSGCLPMIIQMLILFALYNVFNNYFEFRGASFVPGWIDDLSTGDSVWTWERQIPLLSRFTMNNLRILPFIYTISQLLNGIITQYGGSASANGGQMKFMLYGMPILFFFLFYNVPSGLLLYWTTSNILQIGQQLIINRIMRRNRAGLEVARAPDKNTLKFKGGKKKTR